MFADTDNPEGGLGGPAPRRMAADNRTPTSADRPGRDKLTLSMEISDLYLGMGQDAFERLVRPFGLIEMARTGEIAIARGRGET